MSSTYEHVIKPHLLVNYYQIATTLGLSMCTLGWQTASPVKCDIYSHFFGECCEDSGAQVKNLRDRTLGRKQFKVKQEIKGM